MQESMVEPGKDIERPSVLRLITLVGPGYIKRPYVQRCVRSWQRIVDAEPSPIVVDAGMSKEDQDRAANLGLDVSKEHEDLVRSAVANRPSLEALRNKFFIWKKVVDPVVLGKGTRTVVIDTDVYVTRRVALPVNSPSFIYQCDDVPAYRGSWKLPLCEPMVYSLNAGFLVIQPDCIDLDHMEYLAKRYFINYPVGWWTDQSMWSTIMAGMQEVAIFDGRDVRTFSGSRKRTLEEARSNEVRFFGNSEQIDEREEAKSMIHGLSIIHFAGRGKAWIDLAGGVDIADNECHVIRVCPAKPVSMVKKLMLSFRMVAVHAKTHVKRFRSRKVA